MFVIRLLIAILFTDLAFIFTLLGHEFGHAIAIRLLHGRVTQITAGSGWVFARFRWGDSPVLLKIIPSWGFTESPDLPEMPKVDQRLVYVAGPFGSLATAAIFGLLYQIAKPIGPILSFHFAHALGILVLVNVAMAVINLIPVPPLDGFRIISAGWKPSKEQSKQIQWLSTAVIILSVLLAVFSQPLLWKL